MEPLSLSEPGIPAGNSSSVAQEKFHVLVGVTGSVAALKLPLLVAELLKIPGLEVKVVTTEKAKHFYNAQEIPVTLYGDEEEWQLWKGRSDPVLHIELRRWADLMVVAPLDANTLAKVANGICDNLLTCVIRAWDLSKPLLFCPAMNTAMWEHPITARHVEQLKGFGYTEIPCVVKKLVCGDEGVPRQWVRGALELFGPAGVPMADDHLHLVLGGRISSHPPPWSQRILISAWHPSLEGRGEAALLAQPR
ncbi:phosphopantothenoylcysteine decarboxylase isoform X1 [Catharus ustulatus]|uniref:phosphopantothenoylcysteine decarboxylase isoform X1 n=1 Tax=Catharus ustulatus TaxID=91951 RepID=UPI00140D31D2|nr:phosphopantothenoylcysteine decarboxylase isoform X1 [Catharus ustulatus]